MFAREQKLGEKRGKPEKIRLQERFFDREIYSSKRVKPENTSIRDTKPREEKRAEKQGYLC